MTRILLIHLVVVGAFVLGGCTNPAGDGQSGGGSQDGGSEEPGDPTGDSTVGIVLEGNENPDVSISGAPDTVAQGNTFTTSASGYDSYAWYLNGASGHAALTASGGSADIDTGQLSTSAHTLSLFVTQGSNTYSAQVTFTVVEPPPPQTLIELPSTGSSGDYLSRGFYVDSYPGTTLDTVTLYIATNAAGEYTVSLTARIGTYDGTLLGSVDQTLTLSDDNGSYGEHGEFVFDFNDVPVTSGEVVTFQMDLVSGAGGSVAYDVQTSMTNTGVTQTNGTTPPLDSPRRDGVAVTITGRP